MAEDVKTKRLQLLAALEAAEERLDDAHGVYTADIDQVKAATEKSGESWRTFCAAKQEVDDIRAGLADLLGIEVTRG